MVGISLWDEQDGFFYNVLRRPDGSSVPLKVRSAEHPYVIKVGGQEYHVGYLSAGALRTGGRGAIKRAATGEPTGAAR